ncbi:MAG: choice-of-anchor Q domain-containing protein [Segetibacter sp.]
MPEFDSIDAARQIFNFHLKPTSPAIDTGVPISVSIDLDGKTRGTLNLPDLGCYEQ